MTHPAAILVTLLLALGAFSARALEQPLIGAWRYDGFIFENHRYPNPNPNLELTFEFRPDGYNRLFWSRSDESGFCERLSKFRVEEGVLFQTVVWLNPANHGRCFQDPDMRADLQTATAYVLEGDELRFLLDLDGKTLWYILKSVPGSKPVTPPR